METFSYYLCYYKIARLVQNFGLKNNIAISFAGGYKANQGRIYPLFIPNKSYCFNCLANYLNKKATKLGKRLYNRQIIVSSNAQMGKFISSVVSSEILKYLSGVIEPYVINQFLSINFLNYEIEKHPFVSDDKCEYCKNIKGDFI